MWTQQLPKAKPKLGLVATAVSVAVGALMLVWSVYVIDSYGGVLFMFLPVIMGYTVAVILGLHPTATRNEAMGYATLAMVVLSLGLLAFAFEGLICLVMAAPIGLLFAWFGAAIGFEIHKRWHNKSHQLWVLLVITCPFLTAFESEVVGPTVMPVTTTTEINASPQQVWDQIIEFPHLREPEEWFFKTGLAYPINAHIEGPGVGAVRHCNFSTGSFVEPITVWDEPNLLAFDVTDQPVPMVELSPYSIEPPHMHGYFTSVKGQFKLTELPNGGTLLEGTTWYYVDIHPEFYWRWWSDYIIHRIHQRVLNHIKELSETNQPS